MAALARSCGLEQVSHGSFPGLLQTLHEPSGNDAWVVVNPLDDWTPALMGLTRVRSKIIVLGALAPALADFLKARTEPLPQDLIEAAGCAPASTYQFSESAARVRWLPEPMFRLSGRTCRQPERALRRYDFTDEWNNLGFGAITADGSPWSLAQCAWLDSHNELAQVTVEGRHHGAYAGLWDQGPASLLWFNRSVGPIDSQEWRWLEDFLSDHRPSELPCWPVLGEIPHGFDAAVTMRLDCDEDVESARTLWQVYQREGVPFSLALHAKVLADAQHHVLPREVLAAGGAILSHTATHAPDWGGSYEAAYLEGKTSADVIRDTIGHTVRYAVSPFHQTPVYARLGLADAGYCGCIGGIIRNDFDFLMARSGLPPFSGSGFIGHSQQCMLHGDCLLEGDDPIAVFKQAFDLACEGGAFFGYLDHPFSERYQYGWLTETQRADAHMALIQHMRQRGKVLFANEDQAMDFLHDRAHTRVQASPDGFLIARPPAASSWPLQVRYKGQSLGIESEGLVR
ncbi:MAG: polysaccharide deacetylase [Betaproteobacteria bacterium HGW-Betaproteobacteria-9]|nr:polysaccharide deacetylase [Hydrogenophaga sp.]PKO26779.1 MAG: polysaccharide deacetylase [Betaproteobacteria bacterium HGW-Betaproteobacteria-9]